MSDTPAAWYLDRVAPISLARVGRLLRFALVCVALVWLRAPLPAPKVVDAIALVASSGAPSIDREARRATAESAPAARGREPSAAPRPRSIAPLVRPAAPALEAPPPRRIYLDLRVLRC